MSFEYLNHIICGEFILTGTALCCGVDLSHTGRSWSDKSGLAYKIVTLQPWKTKDMRQAKGRQ
jgi:hypothetical protein